MKILAAIPVEKVAVTANSHKFRSETMECDVVRVIRYSCDSWRDRYTYSADVVPPARMHPEYVKMAHDMRDNTVRVNIVRRQNPRWKPPVFPKGINLVMVTE